jgi:hypothetical protein
MHVPVRFDSSDEAFALCEPPLGWRGKPYRESAGAPSRAEFSETSEPSRGGSALERQRKRESLAILRMRLPPSSPGFKSGHRNAGAFLKFSELTLCHCSELCNYLIPSTSGANSVKRKFIREARDLWYEICAKRFAADPDRLDELKEMLKNSVTYEDFQTFKEEIMDSFTQSFQTPRAENEILAEIDKLFDQVWYNRHLNWKYRIKRGIEPKLDASLWKVANNAAQRVSAKYAPKDLGPWTEFEWGMINGKLSALRWVLGDEWDFLGT